MSKDENKRVKIIPEQLLQKIKALEGQKRALKSEIKEIVDQLILLETDM